MSLSRREFMIKSAAAAAAVALWSASERESQAVALGTGPFEPSWDSLLQYECPEWFRDAKFGLWAHWSAQCVPEQGDWYAQQMYHEGSGDYEFHCKTYGHPSVFGFKDIDHIWKAEKWDPDAMMALYKAAGAKYFVALANHHDNFDCYDSAYQPDWNTTKIGPMKDIVGTWAKVARKNGLKFGVTVHASHTWNWLEDSQGSDSTGPYAGVPYDGKLTKADGVGKWWNGLDPQDLYAQNHPVGGGGWEFEGSTCPPSEAYCEKFYNRTIDLIDKYNPDLLYFDDAGLPLHNNSDVGLRIAAHYYNASMQRHNGKVEAIFNTKGLDETQRKCMVLDYERGKSDSIDPSPWQTDTCIGNWHYQRSLYDNHQYKTADQVVKMLLDIVSKNGNLLLNIPVRGTGEFDSDEIAFLHDLAAWMPINEEAIFASRPWKVPGEGPIVLKGGGFSEGGETALGARDFRFTTKGNVLYAAAMGWPDSGKLLIRTLSGPNAGIVGTVSSVELLGSGPVVYTQTDNGLELTMPANRPCDYAYVFKIQGLDLQASAPQPLKPDALDAEADGSYKLTPDIASITGDAKLQGGTVTNIGYWNTATDTVAWNVHFAQPGTYTVSVQASSQAGTTISIDSGAGSTPTTQVIASTGGWDTYQVFTGALLVVPAAGDRMVTVKAADVNNWQPINLAGLTLTPKAN